MTYISDHAGDATLLKWLLLHLDWGDSDGNVDFRFTDCDVPIVYDSQTWEVRGFTIGTISLSSEGGASCTISIPDADQKLFPQLSDTLGAQGRMVLVYEAYFASDNDTNTPTEVKQIFSGRVISTRKQTAQGRDDVDLQCGPPIEPDAAQIPPRLYNSLLRTIP